MEFKTTFTDPAPPRRHRQKAFTLVEFMVVSALSVLVLAAAMSMFLFTVQSIASATNSVDLNARSRHAIDRMSKKLRQTTALNSFSSTAVSVTYNGKPLSYTFDANRGTLVENEAGSVTTLLADCQELSFSLYQRNPETNSFNQFPLLQSADQAKVIQVNWRCGRTLVGRDSGSAEMVSAKIVIRAN